MRIKRSPCNAGGLLAALLMAGLPANLMAQNPMLDARPLTPWEITSLGLPAGTQPSGGLHAVGLGQPVYLEALVAIDAPEGVQVTWALTKSPIGSINVLEDSPLGEVVPVYEPKQREEYKVAGRKMLRPTVVGDYSVMATVTIDGVATELTIDVTASTYMGIQTCTLCHSGGASAPNMVDAWKLTGHSRITQEDVDGITSSHARESCLACHATGYDKNPLAVNSGFDDVAKDLGWTYPAELVPGNYAAMPAKLQNISNVQCEACHGAASQHAITALTDPEGSKAMVNVDYMAGTCTQCHSGSTHHTYGMEWENSKHAVAVEEGGSSCAGCHQGIGFIDQTKGLKPRSDYSSINCTACHEPHDATNPHQLRSVADVTLMDTSKPGGPTVVTEGGNGKLCMNCHISRRDAVTYVETDSPGSHFGPHHGPQTDMFVGANAITYDKDIPSSAHYGVIEDSCATCHMQETSTTSPEWTHVGGHTWEMAWDGPEGRVELTAACTACHGEIEGFNFRRKDYDGDGMVEGVQTEVKGLLTKLELMLPPVGSAYPEPGPDNLDIGNNKGWTRQQLKAAYNYLFVVEDGSWGAHNMSYTVGILNAAIADLSGDANSDGIADWWQQQYFGEGWGSNPDAAPNASPAGDGVPNWLKFSLNLDPHVAGVIVPDGVVWANGKDLGGNPAEGAAEIRIYTAAEIAFSTVATEEYQIQATSNVSGGWQNVGAPIPGTGQVISYLTPTRHNVQQFYRVVHGPKAP